MFANWLKHTQQIYKLIASFIRLRTVAFILWKRQHPKAAESQQRSLKNLFTHCHQINLSVFIQCLIHNDFAGLVAHGNPPQRQRLQAWDLLYMEYCDLSGAVVDKKILSLGREVGMLESKLLTIRTCVLVLSIRYSVKMVDLLHKNGYHYDLDPDSGQRYVDELQMIVKKSKAISVAIEQKRYEHEQLKKKYKGEAPTEQYFDELLVELSKYLGTLLHAKDLSVTEFVAIRNNHERYCKAQQREVEKIKKKTRHK